VAQAKAMPKPNHCDAETANAELSLRQQLLPKRLRRIGYAEQSYSDLYVIDHSNKTAAPYWNA
jgi:hypothetical protein